MTQEAEIHLYDKLCGKQRDRSASEYGKVVVPVIWLWDSSFRTKVIAVAEHDEPVKILERHFNKQEKRYYFYVVPYRAIFVGCLRRLRGWLQKRKPSGWVPAPFLKRRGDSRHEIDIPDWEIKELLSIDNLTFPELM